MQKVKSKDGTIIAYDKLGRGPAVVLISGGSVDRTSNARLASLLSESFTAYNYDRRGRGDSGDTPPYSVKREIEDIEAVISAAGGMAFLYGSSSGAALALEAVYVLRDKITKLVLWEPPNFVDKKYPPPPPNTAEIYTRLVSAGKRGEAVEFFMTKVVGLPPEFAAAARKEPWWAAQEAIAHTLAYDATIMGDYSLPVERVSAINIPTLVMDGEASFPFLHSTADAIAKILPRGQRQTLAAQQHNVSPEVLASAMKEFLKAS
ncbi:MAG TPA: alpha/beta hydrolase [Thermodesulfobacteriota bacterium]|nr:alpha/beta hydrolase [Thermodesulfobacteriota bacterium]